jgi:hypothetical protein
MKAVPFFVAARTIKPAIQRCIPDDPHPQDETGESMI